MVVIADGTGTDNGDPDLEYFSRNCMWCFQSNVEKEGGLGEISGLFFVVALGEKYRFFFQIKIKLPDIGPPRLAIFGKLFFIRNWSLRRHLQHEFPAR